MYLEIICKGRATWINEEKVVAVSSCEKEMLGVKKFVLVVHTVGKTLEFPFESIKELDKNIHDVMEWLESIDAGDND